MIHVELAQGSDWFDGGLPPREGAAVVAAAEGGDRLLRLLSSRPRRVAAVDRNPAQLRLLEFKLAAVKSLRHSDYLELAGLRPSRRRRALYPRIRWLLRKESDEFWQARLDLLDRGIAMQGSFERRVASFRHFIRLVHGRRRVERFQALKTQEERRVFYRGEWQTCLWRTFGPTLWRKWFNAPPEHLDRLLLEGRLLAPPLELSEAEFEAAKELANRVIVVEGPPESYLRSLPDGSVDAFMLGRMNLEGMERELVRVATPGARATFVTDRDQAVALTGFVPERTGRDAGFFPGTFVAGRFMA